VAPDERGGIALKPAIEENDLKSDTRMKEWLHNKLISAYRLLPVFENQQSVLRAERERIKAQIAISMPKNPLLKGFKVYSQTDEDGIIENILSQIKGEGTFIEIGCGHGRVNNTHYLLLKGYKGVWVDASETNVDYIRANIDSAALEDSRLKLLMTKVGLENVDDTVRSMCAWLGSQEPDLFSLDIDGNDYFILERAMRLCQPKVLCVEYNAKFPPPLRMSIVYDGAHSWVNDDYHGATLQMFCDLLKDYRLACCNLSGANAFFVRDDLAGPFERYPVAELFQPARYELRKLSSGHNPSLKWLNDALKSPRTPSLS